MPILKGDDDNVFLASQSLGAGLTVTGANFDLRTRHGTAIIGRVTNGATGPTTPPEFTVQVSHDNFLTSTFKWTKQLAKTADNEETDMPVILPPEIKYARVKFTAGTGQASTVEAIAMHIDTLG